MITKTEEEWRALLPPLVYHVTRAILLRFW